MNWTAMDADPMSQRARAAVETAERQQADLQDLARRQVEVISSLRGPRLISA